MAEKSEVEEAFALMVSACGANFFCQENERREDRCREIAVVEYERLNTGTKWHYCEQHARSEEVLPPRIVRRRYALGEAVLIVQAFINQHSEGNGP